MTGQADGLRLSRSVTLPAGLVTDTLAVVGRRGSGKTYAASVLAEEMLAGGAQVAVLDPTGVWWGLRSPAAGRARGGFEVVVFGGNEADVPLEPTGGQLVADVLVDHQVSAVLDLSLMKKAERTRFLTDFGERLYFRKGPAAERTPLHLFVDEAHTFVPQRPLKGQERMLGAGEDLVQMGRSRGIGVTLISQRPAVVNKNVLSQCSGLVAMQLTAPQDRKALDDWLAEVADQDLRREIVGALPGLPAGDAVVWLPHLGVFERTRVRARVTFDSSSTPGAGEAPAAPSSRVPVDLAAVAEAMSDTIERARAADPKRLAAEAAGLRRRVAELEAAGPPGSGGLEAAARQELEDTITGLRARQVELEELLAAGDARVVELEALLGRVGEAAAGLAELCAGPPTARPAPLPAPRPVPLSAPHARARSARPAPPPVSPAGDAGELPALKAGARRMLEVLARFHPGTMTRSQVATAAGIKKTGGTFSTYWSTLRRLGLIVEDGDRDGGQVTITPEGFDAIGATPDLAPLTHDELIAMWNSKLKAGARRMLAELVAVWPGGLTRQELADRSGIEVTGGTFSTYLGTLRSNGLAAEADGEVRADAALFPDRAG